MQATPSKSVLIVSQYHIPEIGAAATRWKDYAQILSKKGINVTVLTEVPNYPSGIIHKNYNPYIVKTEMDPTGAYRIIRVPVWANPRRSTVQRIGFYISFLISSALLTIKLGKFDHVIVTSPPLTVGLIGWFYKKLYKTRVTLDIRDIWPESAIILGELNSNISRKLAFKTESLLYKNLDGFLIAVPGFRTYLENKVTKPIIDLPNGVSDNFIELAENCKTQVDSKFTVLFSGNIGLAQDMKLVIDAAEKLKNEAIGFKIIGDGANLEKTKARAIEKNLSNIIFIDSMSQDQLIHEIKRSSICLVPLIKSQLFHNAIPSKMIEYMACEKPVIASILGEAKDLISQSDCGMATEPGNKDELASAILHYFKNKNIIAEHGENGRAYVKKYWLKSNLAEKLIENI